MNAPKNTSCEKAIFIEHFLTIAEFNHDCTNHSSFIGNVLRLDFILTPWLNKIVQQDHGGIHVFMKM